MFSKVFLTTLAVSGISSVASAVHCTGSAGSIASYIAALPVAQSFCSAKHPVPDVTSTSTAPAVTATTTVATNYVNTTVATNYVNSTVSTSTFTMNTTSIVTATANTTTTASTTVTSTITTATTLTATATATSTVTISASTVFVQSSGGAKMKRSMPTGFNIPPSWGPRPGTSNNNGPFDPASRAWDNFLSQEDAAIGSICTCIETPKSTTVTITPTSTKSVTAMSMVPITATSTNSLTASTTTTLTFTSTTTTTLVFTTTTTFTDTATATSSTTTTTTTTMTTTKTSANVTETIMPGPLCNDPNTDRYGAGGCSSNCFCNTAVNGANYCTGGGWCDAHQCTLDSDCLAGFICTNNPLFKEQCGFLRGCEDTSSCTSAGLTKRNTVNILGMGIDSRSGRFTKVDEARSAWDAKQKRKATM